ncbi:MAG: hypothetical protein NC923_06540 [Candidatus Omnitrophica bacterium]|nr:hypothetical protein [Candidatus Omnitrophota bacterium]
MKEYTFISLVSVFVNIFIDRALKIDILQKKEFYIFLSIIVFFKLLVNSYLTGTDIVMYDQRFF